MDDANERWLPIPRFDIYEVSDQGRVRSVDRLVRCGSTGERLALGVVLMPMTTKTGYLTVGIYQDQKLHNRRIHQLVLEAFVGPRPEGFSGCHNNGDPSDNRLENLRWDTAFANMQDCIRHGRNARVQKTHCPKGHPYSGVNLIITKTGSRHCHRCKNARGRRLYREKKLSA